MIRVRAAAVANSSGVIVLKFSATQSNGRKLVVFGLTHENIKRLSDGNHIEFKLEEISEFAADVLIYVGKTESEMMIELERGGIQIPKDN